MRRKGSHRTPVRSGPKRTVPSQSPSPGHPAGVVTYCYVTVDHYFRDLVKAGRNAGPPMLWDWAASGEIAVEDLRNLICDVWSSAEWPEPHLGARRWVSLFRECGFVADPPRPPPSTPLLIFRGTALARARGLSWTTDLEKAKWFAERTERFGHPAGVFQVIVRPLLVLAQIDSRNESEVIVNMPAVRNTELRLLTSNAAPSAIRPGGGPTLD